MREDAALVAFSAAHLAPIPAHRRRPKIKTLLVNALGLKLAAAALAAVAVGGLAYAASTGVLPDPLNPGPASKTPGNQSTPASPTASHSPGGLRTTGEQMEGWCTAYLNAGSAEEKNGHLTADLVAAAGGEDRVDDYCVALVGPPKPKPTMASPKPKPKPTMASPQPRADVTIPPRPSVSPRPEPPSRRTQPSARLSAR